MSLYTQRVLGCVVGAALASGWATTTMAVEPSKFPATGQKTCWDSDGVVIPCRRTGQDGQVRAGSPLSYIDNGDGTIIDQNTNLQWEKLSDDDSIHDKDRVFRWSTAVTDKIAALNAENFAGHNDWRLPNARELPSIVNYQLFNPAVSPFFNKNCVPGATVQDGSCTAAGGLARYWSSSSVSAKPNNAWVVGFFDGGVGPWLKSKRAYVRAVRGGL